MSSLESELNPFEVVERFAEFAVAYMGVPAYKMRKCLENVAKKFPSDPIKIKLSPP